MFLNVVYILHIQFNLKITQYGFKNYLKFEVLN